MSCTWLLWNYSIVISQGSFLLSHCSIFKLPEVKSLAEFNFGNKLFFEKLFPVHEILDRSKLMSIPQSLFAAHFLGCLIILAQSGDFVKRLLRFFSGFFPSFIFLLPLSSFFFRSSRQPNYLTTAPWLCQAFFRIFFASVLMPATGFPCGFINPSALSSAALPRQLA